jgi:hypothetical protein
VDGPASGGQEFPDGAASFDLVTAEALASAVGRRAAPGVGGPGPAAAGGGRLAPVGATTTGPAGAGIPGRPAPS